ncbi:MAG: hypothetical protein WAV04_01525 [Candidatus Microsaccharimonas sp.]
MTFTAEHELDEERLFRKPTIGEVVEVSNDRVFDALGRSYHRREVVVGDQSDNDPNTRQKFFEMANHAEMILALNPHLKPTTVERYSNGKKQLVVDRANKPAMELYYDQGFPTQMTEWGTQMMLAIALEPLQRLDEGGGRFLKDRKLDSRTLELFTYMPDGIGLRARQAIYSDLLVRKAEVATQDRLQIVSLGSGAAVPNIRATLQIERQAFKEVDWNFFDNDAEALASAELLISESTIEHSSFEYGPSHTNEEGISAFEGRSYIEARHVEKESLHVVDALGLWEYLNDNEAATFLRMMYPKLRSGGSMIVSNMLKSRPHPLYNQKAVGWPEVIMRSDTELLSIVQKSRTVVDTDQVVITHSQDGVYAVMEIRKP